MGARMSVRIDRRMRERIERIARRKRVSVSAAIREAIVAWVNQREPGAERQAVSAVMGSS
jgi:Arc/MetJ-type ribon-helix-helix transcriptional regulator